MYTVNILLRHTSTPITLVYDSAASARALFDRLHQAVKPPAGATSKPIVVKDDYELEGFVLPEDIASVTFSDFNKDMEKNGDLSLAQAKAQVKAQNAARNDPGFAILNSSANLSRQ